MTTDSVACVPHINSEFRSDGSILLRTSSALERYPQRATERLLYWAERTPDRIFLAVRNSEGNWRELTYAEDRSIKKQCLNGEGHL